MDYRLSAAAAARPQEAGFALIDLLLVIIVIAILATIAVPSYIGSRERAEDAAASANVREAVPAVEAYYADHGTYAKASPALTPEHLRATYDAGVAVDGTRFRYLSPVSYCLSATVGDSTWSKDGPGGEIRPGRRCQRSNAAQLCDAEQRDPNFAASHGGKSFVAFYVVDSADASAFGKCVSEKVRALSP